MGNSSDSSRGAELLALAEADGNPLAMCDRLLELSAWVRDDANTAQLKTVTAASLSALAERGNPLAQERLGMFLMRDYEHGARAVEPYRKAAEQGHAPAQNKLAECYSLGRFVEQDDKQAMALWSRAAAQGQDVAQQALLTRPALLEQLLREGPLNWPSEVLQSCPCVAECVR